MNINTLEHWNHRYASGDWQHVGGNEQTRQFAIAQAQRMHLPSSFDGTLVDFGCGEGDAAPVFRSKWPRCRYVGVDFSAAAIRAAKARYDSIATFVAGSHESCPKADVVVASNILEHLEDDETIVRILLEKCRHLYIAVPFEEQFLIEEHVRRYDRHSFSSFQVISVTAFACRGWSHYGLRNRWWNIYAKNLLRPIFGRPTLNRRLQAIYHLKGQRTDE